MSTLRLWMEKRLGEAALSNLMSWSIVRWLEWAATHPWGKAPLLEKIGAARAINGKSWVLFFIGNPRHAGLKRNFSGYKREELKVSDHSTVENVQSSSA